MKLTNAQVLVLKEITMYLDATSSINDGNGYCELNIDQLTHRIGKNKRTVQRALKALTESGVIHKVDITGYPSLYMQNRVHNHEAARMAFNGVPYSTSKGGNNQTLQLSIYGQELSIHRRRDYYTDHNLHLVDDTDIPY